MTYRLNAFILTAFGKDSNQPGTCIKDSVFLDLEIKKFSNNTKGKLYR